MPNKAGAVAFSRGRPALWYNYPMRIKCLIVCAVVVVLAHAAFFVGRSMRSGESSADSSEAGVTQVSRRIADAGRKAKPAARSDERRPKPVLNLDEDDGDDEESKRTPEERKLAADVEKALDEEYEPPDAEGE